MAHRKRVVVTGMGLRSPIGDTLENFSKSLQEGFSGIQPMPDWDKVNRLRAKVAGLCVRESEEELKRIPRKNRRSMGPISIMAALAAKDSIESSGLTDEQIASPDCGVSFGSTEGSTNEEVNIIQTVMNNMDLTGLIPSSYLKVMSHTCAANLATLFGTRGPFIASCTACVSGAQGIGFGYEAITHGRSKIMITGGADEVHFLSAAVFDVLLATSTGFNDQPDKTPRPFDRDRDGLVVAEGAGCLILEEYEHARKRGANIMAEVLGYWTNSSGRYLTDSDHISMGECMEAALTDAGVNVEDVGYVNAHATATEVGDVAEALATHNILGNKVPVSGLKGYMGHTLGASGALEAIASILMAREKYIAPTRNLENVDTKLAPLNHVLHETIQKDFKVTLSNNFAFGGVNTSLVLKKI